MKIKKILTITILTAVVYIQPALTFAEDIKPAQSTVVESTQALIPDGQDQVGYISWLGTVKLPKANLNVRKSPSLDAEIIGKLVNEDQVEVLEQSTEWATIKYGESIAYVSLQYLEIVENVVTTNAADEQTAIVPQTISNNQTPTEQLKLMGTVMLESGNLNVRKGPSMKDDIIGKLPNQSEVEVFEQSTEWATISHNGFTGYVSLAYLKLEQIKVEQNRAMNEGYKKVIVLDPGHGGKDPGAIAKDGTYESKLVWEYTLKTKQSLEKAGYIVHTTRSEKNSCTAAYKKVHDELDCRISLVNKVKGDIYIAIHADANPKKTFRGTVTFYNDRNDLDGNINPFSKESKKLAQFVQAKVQPVIGSVNRGITNQNYYVNRMNIVPSVLLELGVMTNAADLKILKDTKNSGKVAEALVKAVNQYFGYTI